MPCGRLPPHIITVQTAWCLIARNVCTYNRRAVVLHVYIRTYIFKCCAKSVCTRTAAFRTRTIALQHWTLYAQIHEMPFLSRHMDILYFQSANSKRPAHPGYHFAENRIWTGVPGHRWCIHTYSPGHAGSRGPLHPTVGVSDKTRLLCHSHRKLPSLTYAQCHLLLPRVLSPPPVPASPSSTNQPTNPQNPRRNHAAPPCSASPPASPYARSNSPRRRRLHRPPTPPGSTSPGSPQPAPSVPRLWPA